MFSLFNQIFIILFCNIFAQPMKTLKPTTPTSTAQKVTGQPRQTQMETALIPQLLDPQILFTLSRGSFAYR